VSGAELGWLLVLPLLLVAAPLVLLVSPWLGDLLFPRPSLHYWSPEFVVRKPAVQAGYLLLLSAVFAYGGAIVALAGRRPRMPRAGVRAAVLAAQLLVVALIVVAWVAQRRLDVLGTRRVYFTPASIVVAAVLAGALVYAARVAPRMSHTTRRRPSPRVVRTGCLVVAILTVTVWVLPAVYTDRGMSALDSADQLAFPAELFGNTYYFDEATAVLNGRSPLVDMPAYGALWPYVVALPFGALGGTYAAYSALMAAITGAAMVAVYAILRRIAGSLLALLLFVPFVATSFFIELGDVDGRYDPGNYFGVFPLRYAGPYLLAWLTARTIVRERASAAADVALFAAAGLVALNNVDFGASALLGTIVAVAIVRRPLRARRLAAEVAGGVAVALALVFVLTLLRAGSLPHLGLLGHYGRVFVDGGYGNIALHLLGWHLVLTVTFVAAVATAAVRVAQDARDRLLTAMLAWAGIFGLGASVYFYAYRSHPDVLLNIFSAWAFALVLLTIVVLRAERLRERLPALPALLVLFGFGLAVCSVAQVPRPWSEVSRIVDDGGESRPLVLSAMAAEVRHRTRPGEHVAIFVQVGHRVAREAGVVNVSPYPGFKQMPAREQLDETLERLRRDGGRAIFVGQEMPPGMAAYLHRRGWEQVRRSDGIGWSGEPVFELRLRGS
jgi:hypothetical protein